MEEIKFIQIKLINGKVMDYEREFLDGLTNGEIGMFLMGMETLKREMMEDFEQRNPLYSVSTDSNDMEDTE